MYNKYDNRAEYGVATVSDICRLRKDMDLSCHNCKYYGEVCDNLKQKYQVDRPSLLKEEKQHVNYKSQQKIKFY